MNLTIDGEPTGKGRPRFANGHAYTPEKTRDYERYTRILFVAQNRNVKPLEGMVAVNIKAYFGIPKSKSKRQKEDMAIGIIRPTKKPDTDNITKIILDSLNGLAYLDDKQVVDLQVAKWYGKPRVEVEILEL